MPKFTKNSIVNRKHSMEYYEKAFNPKTKNHAIEGLLQNALQFERYATYYETDGQNSADILEGFRICFHTRLEKQKEGVSAKYLQILELYQQIRASAEAEDKSREDSKDIPF